MSQDYEHPVDPPDDVDDGTPIFGEGPLSYRSWRLVIHAPNDGPDGHTDTFRGYQDVDAGMTVRVMRAATENARLEASAMLILSTAADDDGLPVGYRPPRIQQDDPRLDDPDFDLVPGDVDEADPDFDSRVFDDEPGRPSWSSRRRLAWIFDDPSLHVSGKAIEQMARWIAREGSGRPTGRPTRSSRGQDRTGRGSAGQHY